MAGCAELFEHERRALGIAHITPSRARTCRWVVARIGGAAAWGLTRVHLDKLGAEADLARLLVGAGTHLFSQVARRHRVESTRDSSPPTSGEARRAADHSAPTYCAAVWPTGGFRGPLPQLAARYPGSLPSLSSRIFAVRFALASGLRLSRCWLASPSTP